MSTAAPSGLRWLTPRPSPPLAEQAPHDALARVAWEGRCIKDEEETWVGADATHHWKLYRVPLRRRLFASLVRSRSRREWNALRCAEQAGLPGVPPAGCAESRSGPILTSSLLVVESVEAEDVRRLFENPEHPRTLRLRWAQALGQAIRAFHEAGFVHFRMQLRNLLLTEPDNNPDVVWL
ncbi:MAG: hypothetical protein MK213_05605, partial [Planctomycetes bacterium]|nr:hypothetical protein [Planctomycetota bacterium]